VAIVETLNVNLWGTHPPGNIKADGQSVGDIRWDIYHGPTFQNFDAFDSGFDFYRRQIPAPIFPTAFIESIDVDDKHRRQGYASAALRIVLARVKRKGVKTAFLRVGFNSSEEIDHLQDRDWKVSWYEREGFIRLDNEKPDNVVPYMWHPLTNILKSRIKLKIINRTPKAEWNEASFAASSSVS
jgi:GNAT superfamily N-acetyltransferase